MKITGEIVFFYLYDAGRSIDLEKAAALVNPAGKTERSAAKRDSPASLILPEPLVVDLFAIGETEGLPFAGLSLTAKVFEEGAVSVIVRASGEFRLEDLHAVRTSPFTLDGRETDIDAWAESSFTAFFDRIRECITFEPFVIPARIRETYTAYCISSRIAGPEDFVRENRRTIACLLNGEGPERDLHESQIAATLKDSFSYTARDYALFDLDRCLIIDPERGYEDILRIVEQANFLLLELRSLDQLLDHWLDLAEDDVTIVFRNNRARLKPAKAKLAGIKALAFDALFILENLENSSKIIGDYFLGRIFTNLCARFNTTEWTRSIERHLETLDSVYERVKTLAEERRMMTLEIMFIAVCVIFPVLQIIQAFLLYD